MPKQKTHSGAKKRLRRTGSGKLALKRNSRQHLLMQKKKRQKRLPRTLMVHPRDERRMAALVPHL
jgi:large subunit ribosomal protein L35